MKHLRLLALVGLAIIAVGCANFNSVHRDFKVSEGTGALIDIKQRAILVSKDTNNPSQIIVCAEPSPDSLSAYAAEIAAKAQLPNGVAAQLSSAFQESSSFTGLRTQSIQLLRDSLYRICEAYMNGAISQSQYDLLARRYQKHTVALLAIEQLTGAIRVPSVTINTNGSAEATRSIPEMRTAIAHTEKSIFDLEKKKNDKSISEEDKNILEENIKSLRNDKDVMLKGIENARSSLVSGSAAAVVSPVGLPTQRSDQHIQVVTNAVKSIVESIINADDFSQLCFLHMANGTTKLSDSAKNLQYYCEKNLQLDQEATNLQLELIRFSLENLKNTPDNANLKKADDAKNLASQAEALKSKYHFLQMDPSRNSDKTF